MRGLVLTGWLEVVMQAVDAGALDKFVLMIGAVRSLADARVL